MSQFYLSPRPDRINLHVLSIIVTCLGKSVCTWVMIAFQPLSMNKRRHQVKPEAQAGMYLMQVNIGLINAQILADIFCN